MKRSAYPERNPQKGIVLIVALVMLVIMSILGITSVRTVALEEKMSSSAYDRSIAMQAAEAALRAGEQDAASKANMNIPSTVPLPSADTPNIVNGFVATPYSGAYNWMIDGADWSSDAGNTETRALDASVDLGAAAGAQPRYLIEYRGIAACKPDLQKETAISNDDCRQNPDAPACNCHLFRITARSNPAGGRAEVFLQSEFTAL